MMKRCHPGVHCCETSTTPQGGDGVPEPEEVSGVGAWEGTEGGVPDSMFELFQVSGTGSKAKMQQHV